MGSLKVTNTFNSGNDVISVEREFGTMGKYILKWEFWESQAEEVKRTSSDVKMSISREFSEDDFTNLFR